MYEGKYVKIVIKDEDCNKSFKGVVQSEDDNFYVIKDYNEKIITIGKSFIIFIKEVDEWLKIKLLNISYLKI